jgi:hypothetical protein
MKALYRIAILSFAVGLYVGCSPTKFSMDEGACDDVDGSCIVENGKYTIGPKTLVAGGGKVDILFVNDNSASMSFEQKNLAARFANFVADLDSRKVDYRIAMITTEVSKGGALVPFGSRPYLTSSDADRVSAFNAAIQRPETRACENFIANWFTSYGYTSTPVGVSFDPNSKDPSYSAKYAANCPSGDERGTYTANLAVQKNPSSFIRKDAHLSIIFISDEDVRSGLYKNGISPLENLDQPATLITTVKNSLGTDKWKTLSIHSITVMDSGCLAQQNSQVLGDNPNPATKGFVTGSYGSVYQTFATAGYGKAVSICETNYTSLLGQIRADITDRIQTILFECDSPSDLSLTGTNISYSISGRTLTFASALPTGTTVTYSYKCSSL